MSDTATGDAHDGTGDTRSGQWRLRRIEVVNWGTFDGWHGVDIARKGHLFTGASGSGKSSLLDAMTAALTPKGSIVFNAAAQDATTRNSDRTWVTYLRGAWSREADELEERTVASYLRTGATWSGILLRFENEVDDPVSLVRLFHLRGTSNDAADVKELNFITRTAEELLTFSRYATGGIDVRRLEADHHPVVSTTTGKHGAYFQRLQRLLGIRNETALQLLHKTQAAKNLGTLDTLFRRFMLDEPTTFRRANGAVEQFGELRTAYDQVVDLRRQRDSLLELSVAVAAFETQAARAAELSTLASGIQPAVVALKLALSRDALVDARARVAKADGRLDRIRTQVEQAEELLTAAQRRLNDLGGGDLIAQRARITDAEATRDAVANRRDRLTGRLGAAGIPLPPTEASYLDLLTTARAAVQAAAPQPLDHALLKNLADIDRIVTALEAELRTLERHQSNVHPGLLRVREELCEELGVPTELLPFAGELIAVRAEFAEWTGAIERVLAPISSSLLVRDDELHAVRRAVNSRHLGVNLTIDAVPAQSPPPVPAADPRSLLHRVDVGAGIFHEYLARRLGHDFDFACVEHPDDLDSVPRGVTRSGLIRRSGRRYTKADRYPVDDRSKWVLGGDIGPKRAEPTARLARARADLAGAEDAANRASAARDDNLRRRQLFEELLELPWNDIDVDAAAERILSLQAVLDELASPVSDLGRASASEAMAQSEVRRRREEEAGAREKRALAIDEQQRLTDSIEELENEPASELPDQVRSTIEVRFREQQPTIRFDQVDAVAMKVQQRIQIELEDVQKGVQEAVSTFVIRATGFNRDWAAAAANVSLTPQIEDRGGYLTLLSTIQSRGLPEHEANFRRLLDTRSRESVTFLRDELLGALRRIESRITPVNESLGRKMFDRDRYLRIRVRLRRSQEVNEFLDQLKTIVDGNWAEEELETAERRFTVLASIMARLGSSERVDREWRIRVLDTREHVSFIAEEVDPNGTVHNVHDSSAGLSGGQRQKLVVFCLAAALRYQLAEFDADDPRYGAVVLDEAFDKADADYTRMAMEIFVAFGFQMILATPGKLLQTLEPYIGAVTVVTNPDRRSSQLANVEYEQ